MQDINPLVDNSENMSEKSGKLQKDKSSSKNSNVEQDDVPGVDYSNELKSEDNLVTGSPKIKTESFTDIKMPVQEDAIKITSSLLYHDSEENKSEVSVAKVSKVSVIDIHNSPPELASPNQYEFQTPKKMVQPGPRSVNTESLDQAEELVKKANTALKMDGYFSKSNEAKLKELDQLITDLEQFNALEQQKIDKLQQQSNHESEENEENSQNESHDFGEGEGEQDDYEEDEGEQEAMGERENTENSKLSHNSEYLQFRHSFDVPTKNMKLLSKDGSIHQKPQNDDNNDEIAILKDEGDLGNLFEDSESKIPDDLSNDTDLIQDHFLINQIADEYAVDDGEGEGEAIQHSEYSQDEENTPKGFYDKLQHADAHRPTPRLNMDEFGFGDQQEELRMKVREEVQQKIHFGNEADIEESNLEGVQNEDEYLDQVDVVDTANVRGKITMPFSYPDTNNHSTEREGKFYSLENSGYEEDIDSKERKLKDLIKVEDGREVQNPPPGSPINSSNSSARLSRISKDKLDTDEIRQKAKNMILRASSEFKNSQASGPKKKPILDYDESEYEEDDQD